MPNSLTPSVKTLDEAIADVANFCKLPATSGTKGYTLADQKLKNAINWFNQRHWAFLLTYEDITMVADTVEYNLTNVKLRKPRSLILLDGNSNPSARRLTYVDPDHMVDLQDLFLVGDGWPRYYTFYNYADDQKLNIDRKPSSGFVGRYPTMRLRYYAMLQIPATGATKFDLPSYCGGGSSLAGQVRAGPRRGPGASRARRSGSRAVVEHAARPRGRVHRWP